MSWFALGPTQTLHVVPEPVVSPSVRHPAILVDDVRPYREALERAGIAILAEPDIPGRERFAFVDPFGNKVEILRVG